MPAAPKPTKIRSRRYLDWLRSQPCIVTGSLGAEPHHLKCFGSGGMATKPGDDEAVPISHAIHLEVHSHGEIQTFGKWWGLPHDDVLVRLAGECDRLWRAWKKG